MRSFICILTLLSLATLCYTLPSKAFSQRSDDLHYYHKYERNHSWAPNVKVPLRQHYSNERSLRQQLYKAEDQMAKLQRSHGFKTRDVKRAELAKENALVKLETTVSADNTLRGERAAALKEEINHDERFREKYHARFLRNKAKLVHATPDQQQAIQTLVNFDRSRDEHFKKAELQENEKLQKEKQEIVNENIKAVKQEAQLKSQIHKLKSQENSGSAGIQFRMTALAAKIAVLEEKIAADTSLDGVRRATEEKETKNAGKGVAEVKKE
jgi:hypothetical protein